MSRHTAQCDASDPVSTSRLRAGVDLRDRHARATPPRSASAGTQVGGAISPQASHGAQAAAANQSRAQGEATLVREALTASAVAVQPAASINEAIQLLVRHITAAPTADESCRVIGALAARIFAHEPRALRAEVPPDWGSFG